MFRAATCHHQPRHAILEVVLLERVAATKAARLNVERLGVQAFLGAVLRDEMRLAVFIAKLQRPLAAGLTRRAERSLNLILFV